MNYIEKLIYICGIIFLFFAFVSMVISIHHLIFFPREWRRMVEGRLDEIEEKSGIKK